MTIAVVWKEDEFVWCAADTRLVAGERDATTTEYAAKIFSIPLATAAQFPNEFARAPHYWTRYGFTFAGSVQPAIMTAITCSTLFQTLVSDGGRANPPLFEDVSEVVRRLAERYMRERRMFDGEGLFSAAFFGWCPYRGSFKVALIEGKSDCGSFRVDLSFPPAPQKEGDPWIVIGSGTSSFRGKLAEYYEKPHDITSGVPRRVIEQMIDEGLDPTVGGSVSLGYAHKHGFDLAYSLVPVEKGKPGAYRLFNGLDLERDIGDVGQYRVGITGLA